MVDSEKDIFVGLPYMFKLKYDSLKDSLDSFNYFENKLEDKSKDIMNASQKFYNDLSEMKEIVSRLFDDISYGSERVRNQANTNK